MQDLWKLMRDPQADPVLLRVWRWLLQWPESVAYATMLDISEMERATGLSTRAIRAALQQMVTDGNLRIESERADGTLWFVFAPSGPSIRVDPALGPKTPTPLTALLYTHSRRARKLGASGSCSPEDVRTKLTAQGGLCFYCTRPMDGVYHIEHMTPLARGGTNGPENICCACPECNLQKNDKTAAEFLAARKAG